MTPILPTSWRRSQPPAEALEEPLSTAPDYPIPSAPAAPLEPPERERLRAAAARATQVHPDAVGELIARELSAWEEFGCRFGGHGFIWRLVEHVEAMRLRAAERAS